MDPVGLTAKAEAFCDAMLANAGWSGEAWTGQDSRPMMLGEYATMDRATHILYDTDAGDLASFLSLAVTVAPGPDVDATIRHLLQIDPAGLPAALYRVLSEGQKLLVVKPGPQHDASQVETFLAGMVSSEDNSDEVHWGCETYVLVAYFLMTARDNPLLCRKLPR